MMAKPSSADSVIARFQVKATDIMIDVFGTCAETHQPVEVLGWSQEVWGLLSCRKEGLRACQHDFPMKVCVIVSSRTQERLPLSKTAQIVYTATLKPCSNGATTY